MCGLNLAIFFSEQWLGKRNNLTYVKSGVTRITFKVPYLWQGAGLSALGLILTAVWIAALCKHQGKGKLTDSREILEELELIEIDEDI